MGKHSGKPETDPRTGIRVVVGSDGDWRVQGPISNDPVTEQVLKDVEMIDRAYGDYND